MSSTDGTPGEPAPLLHLPAEELRTLVALWDDGAVGPARTGVTGPEPRHPSPAASARQRA
jgi:hypothetical protein